jgi:hypothetical protein
MRVTTTTTTLLTLKKIQIHSVIDRKLQMRVKATCDNHKG